MGKMTHWVSTSPLVGLTGEGLGISGWHNPHISYFESYFIHVVSSRKCPQP